MTPEALPAWTAIETAAIAAGLSWASGFRLYAAVFIAGALQHFGMVDLPGHLTVLAHPWVVGASGALMVGEFFADKVPGFDSLWDALHTFVRIPAGAVLAATAFADLDPALVVAAALAGGAIASGTHFTKAGSRAVINTSPEPFSNWTASFAEDVAAPVGLAISLFAPWVWFVLLAVFLLFAVWLVPKLLRAIRQMLARLRPAT